MWWAIGSTAWLAISLLACWAGARIARARKRPGCVRLLPAEPAGAPLTEDETLMWIWLRLAYGDEAGTASVAAREWAAEQLMREAAE